MKILFCSALLFISSLGMAQDLIPFARYAFGNTIGLELQAYPAGLMPGIVGEVELTPKTALHMRLGGNFADRHDWGKHDDETGKGFGATLGYRYYFNIFGKEHIQFSVGPRVDFWKMKINWIRTFEPALAFETGQTDISVFQPTLELAWWIPLAQNTAALGVSFTNGYEINVKTVGEPVGEGLITLLGITYRRKL
jgi:hypothetical protein